MILPHNLPPKDVTPDGDMSRDVGPRRVRRSLGRRSKSGAIISGNPGPLKTSQTLLSLSRRLMLDDAGVRGNTVLCFKLLYCSNHCEATFADHRQTLVSFQLSSEVNAM